MQNKLIRFFIFLVVNFLALAIGSYLMKDGPRSDWYLTLKRAPWTPPGYVFGLAWSVIMFCFAFYMNKLSFEFPYLDKKIIGLYTLQWILCVGWNYAFFNQKQFLAGLIILILLWILLLYLTINFYKITSTHSLLIAPYILWMTIAISLNAYVVLNN